MLLLSFFRSKYVLSVVCVIAFFLVANSAPILDQALAADGVLPPQPVVAIHVSELTQALENMSASPSTPSGLGTTGYEWWPDAWHYFVGHESVKEALSSDGTPFVEVTDSDISSGLLLQSDGSPRYPILISLMSEAIDNAEVGALRNYVSAGGVLFVGASSFTRYPDGKSRGNFALANEMGLQMVSTSLENWKINKTFTKSSDGPIVAHIPSGTLKWAMPLTSDDISWGIDPAHTAIGDHYVWNVNNINAEIIAQGSNGPLLTTKKYGEGYFLYYGAMQPLIGFGGHHCGMYAYGIFRNAIEWSFKQANLPILKLSPWQYSYDSAFMIRHDFENELKLIQSIEASAQIEHSLGVKGDYYFCTGALRESSYDITTTVNSLRRAISDYGATIGSHNGGLPNPVNPNLARDSYDYWHWGPDEALDYTPSGYNTGKEYAIDSIERSFGDIENWFKGLDNGRPDCNLLGNCPRTWVSPWFNATREDSYDILEEIGVVSVGEQKLTPFPHWTVSTETPGKYYSILSLPVSDWYVGSEISQSLEWSPHTVTTIHELVDHYYGLGALINLYNHSPSTAALVQEYILYAKTKPRLWVTNSTGVYDWWQLRSQATVMPTYYEVDGTSNAVAEISGVKDPDTSIEIVIPNWSEIQNHSVQVFVNGSTASPSDFRTTDYGVKCRLASGNSHIEVQYVGPSAITNLEVFPDSFENGLGNWKQDSQNDWYLSTQRATAGSYSAEVDGSASNAQLVSIPIDLQGSTSATVTFSWYIESSLDTGEYIAFDVSTDGGITWVEKARLRGNVDTEEVWHNVKVELTGIQSLILRFRGTMSDSTEDANIDSLSVTIPRTNTAPVATGDAYATNQNTLLSVAAPGVLSNDTDAEGSALTAVLVIGPAHGTLSLNANGSFSYTPTTGYVGSDSFSYMANDGKANSNTATVAITVNNILYSENFDSNTPNPLLPWTIVSGTWKTANGVVQGSSQPWTYATIYLNGQPVWDDYTVEARVRFPAGSYGGGIGGRVNPTTGARYGAWVYPSGSFGGSNVLNLVKFRDWTTWNFSAMQQVSLPNVGTGWHTLKMIFSGNEIKVYYDGTLLIDTVDNNFDSRGPYLSGGISLDSWTYTSSYVMEVDDVAASISELVPVNTAPVATGDAYATNQNTLLSVAAPGVLSNDTDAEGSALTAVLVSGPAHGTLSLNANGSFSYTPTTGYVGSDSFSYRANDGKANSNTATVAITVIAVNTAPVATGDAYATNQNTLLSVAAPGVLSNDTDAEGSALTAVLVSGPAHGTLSLNANGSFSYTPTTGYVGSDSFSYRANDGKANSNTATVAITVIAVNTAPVATGDAYATNQNTLLSVAAPGVLSNDTDAEGSALTAVLVSGPAHGTLSLNANGSFSYTPTTGYVGSDSFSYRANDGKANSNTATVAITVIAVNTAPVATGDAYATNQNTLLSVAAPGVLSNDTDAEGSALTAVLVSGPAHGTLSLNANGSFSYTPTTGYVGSDSFSYRANDGKANSNTATVAITVIAVNTAPVATGDAYATNQNTLLSVAAPGVLSNDTDAEGSALTAVLVSGPAHGTLSLNANGSFSYTPTTGYVGSDSFSYRANDGKANSNTATVAITVIAVNTAPVATGDAYATNQNTLLSVAAPGVLSNDTDAEGSALTAVLVSGPAHGTLSLNANGSFSYTPTTGYVGSDSFSYRANDGKANSNTATVAITVIAVNTAPVATGDAYATNQNTLLSVAAPGVLSNDTDAEGSALTAVLVSGPAHGTLSLNANGSFSYTPTTGYVGSDSFSYRANDGKANSNTATVAITVIAVNTAPVATGDAYATNQNTLLSVAAPGVLSNDTDAEGSALTAVLVSGPAHGTLSLNANGSFSYTPTTGYVGSDSFSYRANDGKANSNTATVAITVNTILYTENFNSNTPNPLLPWTVVSGTWKTANGVVQGSSQAWTYATIYLNGQAARDDYSVEARVRFPSGSYGGGIGGRVNPTTGARYGAWVYPSGSFGGSNVLKLVKFRDWTTWNFSAMQQVSLPNVGTGWHTLKMIFSGNEIKVYYDGTLLIDTVDNNFDSRVPYLSGGISVDSWTYTTSYVMEVDDLVLADIAVPNHEITLWKENKPGAVSLTFDDGFVSQYSVGVTALNEFGFKGTFFVITDFASTDPNFASWDNWRNAANEGHEIGSHSKTHSYLTSLSTAKIQEELFGSKTEIDNQIESQKCLTIAYPYGDYNNDVIGVVNDAGYIAGRSVEWGINSPPYDFASINAIFPDSAKANGVTMESQTDLAEQTGQWIVVGFHRLDGEDDPYAIPEYRFREYIEYLNTKDLWVDTFGSVTKYIRERDSASLSVVSSSSEAIVLNLTDGLDDTIYDEALTIKSAVPGTCISALVQQGTNVTTVDATSQGATKVIYYEAIPDRGNISITYFYYL